MLSTFFQLSDSWHRPRSVYVHHSLFCTHAVSTNQICARLPKITEDEAEQRSQDMHRTLADSYSLSIEEIPPMGWEHATVVGMYRVLPLLLIR